MSLRKIVYALSYVAATALSTPALSETWNVDPERSKLGFEVKQGTGTLKGFFATWDADIDFDPEAPDQAKISTEIKPLSASTGNPQFDGTLPGKDWFDIDAFPVAEFTTQNVSHVEGNSYRADGLLTIKGVAQPVDLEFTLDIDGDTATAMGTATVNRLDYKLGTAVGTDTVGDIVTVTLDLTAVR
ncbi:YceI family protein [Roseibium marinum]|uniref:Polyisoprenoid-binding protein YceI n=1 Tax=Roseibium marinum TaxID=281252 RepID=A0A2S3UNP5_9HYPH|nr:YceI family protein [Roseibium marinum]POF29173.1 polyisoprenoid-binding protein YceI [Roseibium marinum]